MHKLNAVLLTILAVVAYTMLLHNYWRAKYYEEGMTTMEEIVTERDPTFWETHPPRR